MKGDFTRFTFEPKKHLSAVLKQQGRVDLDADWNELIDILSYRLSQQTIDTIGGTGVPKPPGLNPPLAFQLSADATGVISLTEGRIYVDGLVCENSAAPLVYYQPPLPTGDLTGLVSASRTYLFYLHVWRRHVSYLEDAGLLEKALFGPDTTTRIQTAWQVIGVTDPAHAGDCTNATDIPAPSNAVLSWRSAPSQGGTPCVIGGQGGFTGLENRLYRVEVHDPTATTFKWSRDNNSVGLAIKDVLAANPFKLEAYSLGADDRDRLLRHWVEVLTDEAEYANGHGILAQVTDVDEISAVITLDQNVGALSNGTHLRIRRWDMPYQNVGTPLSCQVGTWLSLEDGVEIKFGPAAAQYLNGDYWTIPARTSDSTITPQDDMPAQGIEHHYCKLGFVTWTADAAGTIGNVDVVKCTPTFPSLTDLPGSGLCNCCIEIDGKDDLQKQLQAAALELGKAGGGQIMLPPGVHVLNGSVTIAGPNISIEGCLGQTIVVFKPKKPTEAAFIIEGNPARGVKLKGFDLYTSRAEVLIQIGTALDTTIEHCKFVNLPTEESSAIVIQASNTTRGLRVQDCDLVGSVAFMETSDNQLLRIGITDAAIVRCRVLARLLGVWVERAFQFEIRDTTMRGLGRDMWRQLAAVDLKVNSVGLGIELGDLLEQAPTYDEQGFSAAFFRDIESVLSAGSGAGQYLPIAFASTNSSEIRVADCILEAAVPVWGSTMSAVSVERCTLAGFLGFVVQNSTEIGILNSKFATFLDAIVSGGQTSIWRVVDNVIFGRVGVLVTSEAEAGWRLNKTLALIKDGLAKPVPDWAPFTHPLGPHTRQFDPGPAGYSGGVKVFERLRNRINLPLTAASHIHSFAVQGNAIACSDVGVMLDDQGGVSDLGQVAIVNNQVIGCRAVGIHVKAARSTGEISIHGNQLESNGCGIRVAAAGSQVSANQVILLGRGYKVPLDISALGEVAPDVAYPNLNEPHWLSYPPTVRQILDRTVSVVSHVANPPATLATKLAKLKNAALVGLPYESDLLDFFEQSLANHENSAAASALAAFRDAFMGVIDGVGIAIESNFVSVADNLVRGQTSARAGIVLDAAPVALNSAFLPARFVGPGAAVTHGSFLSSGISRPPFDKLSRGVTPGVGFTSTAVPLPPMPSLPLSTINTTEADIARNRILVGYGHGIDVRRAVSQVRILDNIINSMAGCGVHTMLGVVVDSIEVSRNRITECARGPLTVEGGQDFAVISLFPPSDDLSGIALTEATSVQVNGNVIEGNGGPRRSACFAIRVNNCKDTSIRGNILRGNRNTGPFGEGGAIHLSSKSSSNDSIVDNVFNGNGSGGIWASGCHNLLIAGNQGSSLAMGAGSGVGAAPSGIAFVEVNCDSCSIINNQFDCPDKTVVLLLAQFFDAFPTYSHLIVASNRVTGIVKLPTLSGNDEVVIGNINVSGLTWLQPVSGQHRFEGNIP